MSCPFNKEALDKLKQFVDLCTANPDLLSLPELSFFRSYIELLGGKIPSSSSTSSSNKPSSTDQQSSAENDEKIDAAYGSSEDSDPESDLEIDNDGCVEPDTIDPNQEMGDSTIEINDDDMEKSNVKRSEAMSAFVDGNFDKAIELYTDAIKLNPTSALLFAKRGQTYLKLMKPNACINDCTKALEFNPDSATAYKFRGRAYRLLGDWEKAAKDLRQACNIDLDEQTDEWLKEVTPNAKKIEQHKIKQERRKIEKEEKERLRRLNKAKEAHARASASAKTTSQPPPTSDSATSGGAGSKPNDFYKLLQDPEILAAFTDPEVSAAFSDISSNPANFYKYQSNPKVMTLITKLSGKLAASGINIPFGGAGGGGGGGAGTGFPGFPGGFPGFGGGAGAGFGGAGGAAPTSGNAPTFKPQEDDNLD